MIVFSTTQALSPAIERTKRILFVPFRWWTFLKLSAVAVFTEGFGGNYNFSSPSHSTTNPSTSSPMTSSFQAGSMPAFHLTPLQIGAIVAAILLVFLIGIALFYVVTRLRFALFYCLTYQVKEIRPGWRLYRDPANRFFKLNLVVALIFMVLVILAVAPFAFGFYHMFKQTQAGAHFDWGLFVSLFLPALALLLLIALVAVAVDIVLRDFMLPHFALEDMTAGAAWAQVHGRVLAEKGSFFLYAVLRILLPIAAIIALVIALAIPMLLAFGVCALLFAGAHALAASGTMGASIVGGALEVLIGLAIFTLVLLVAICFGGPLSIWVRNFALVFYGGRYPLLGNVLFPAPPVPPPASSPTPSA
jgi:hypothetical protein